MDKGGFGSTSAPPSSSNINIRSDANKFPVGLRVLVVDDDLTCLKVLERMLQMCLYEVTTCSQAVVALSLLRERKYMFDLVLSDVHMPDMDGFKLLELIGLEMDLPVIMMSMDDKKEVVMKGVTHGACDYLIKPIRMEAIKNIWQHVIRKRRHELKELEQTTSVEDNEPLQRPSEDADNASSANEGSWKNKRRDDEEDTDDKDDNSTVKKPRVVWSIELHQQFVSAVNQLGLDKAVPKKILELMNVAGLTRENVASHLQKYRLYLKRVSGAQSAFALPFMGSPNTSYGLPSLNEFNLQTLSGPGQPPVQNLNTLQTRITRSTGHGDQRNRFGGQPTRLTFGMSNQVRNNNNNQVNLLSGVPSSIGSKLPQTNLHQSFQSFGNIGLQANGSSMNFMPQSQLGQVRSNDMSRQFLGGNEMVHNNTQNPVSKASPVANNPMNQISDFSGHHPLGNSTESSSCLRQFGPFKNGGSWGEKGLPGFTPNYDIFADLRQDKAEGSGFRNVGLSCETSRSSSVAQTSSRSSDQFLSVLGQQGFLSNQTNGKEDGQQHEVPKGLQENENFDAGTVFMPELDTENFSLSTNWSQDDLMTSLFKQQDGAGMINADNFDPFPLDNISV